MTDGICVFEMKSKAWLKFQNVPLMLLVSDSDFTGPHLKENSLPHLTFTTIDET